MSYLPPNYKEPIEADELLECPVNEQLRVVDLVSAMQILKMDVLSLNQSFLTGMHKEMIHQMLQRATMAPRILLSPNLCVELFSFEGYKSNTRYIINKLVGRRDFAGHRIDDFDGLERQTTRKILKLAEDKKSGYMIFFWNKEPNLIREYKKDYWIFYPKSPAYKALVDLYGKFKVVEPE